MSRIAWLLLLSALVGCAYDRGDFRMAGIGSHPPARVQLGCLDLGVGIRGTARSPVVRYGFGNGCDHRIRVDLGAVRAYGLDQAGERIDLIPQDAGWIRARDLGARWFAREAVRYAPQGPSTPLREICLDVAGLHATDVREHWICLATEDV